jgi:hypothetical protein
MRTWTRGTFEVGTNGFGYVKAKPYPASDTGSSTSSQSAVTYSDVTFSGTLPVNSGTGVQHTGTNSPYLRAEFGSGAADARWRAVGCGLRVKCISPPLNVDGMMVALQHPDHDGFATSSYTAINQYPEASTSTVYRALKDWVHVEYTPKKPDDTDYTQSVDSFVEQFLVIAVSATPGTSFHFEYYSLFEVIGRNVPSATAEPTKPWMTGLIQSAISAVNPVALWNYANHIQAPVLQVAQDYVLGYMSQNPGEIVSTYRQYLR